MAYKFDAKEPVRAEVVRCAAEQLDRAISELSERINDDPVGAVHNARKAIKKERSLLRLARGVIASEDRRRENAALREAARELSGTRDADVMTATLDDLADRFAGQVPAKAFDAIRAQLRSRSEHRPDSALQARAVQELGALRVRVDDWKLVRGGWKGIESGLLHSYTGGRKAFARARGERSVENLHAWRKRVKDLWYQQRLLSPTCGPGVRGQAKDAHRLADLLGDDHDLALLREELAPNTMPVPVDVHAVVELIDHRRDELQTEAIALGERVYADCPKSFRRRMRWSWRAGRVLAEAPQEGHPVELAAATRTPSA
ncbi:MAG TPA: CHAD domain-containing protein [Solirubrobacteraceae bacterium]|nr:CHAD domain-containing protein [Solirubrobacteraceae bacterium]